ncbi:MAG TPA: agglutinin biogenesis protein MshP [Burkholderiales bacterium]|nr:agglutinin biogenesis protein MshP [Burkholderiales bacterium]
MFRKPGRVRRARQRGFSLILALFLLVSLAAMGAYLLTISTLQQESSAADELGARAYQAAHSGIDWGLYELLRDSGAAYASACNAAVAPAAPASQTFALSGGLAAFSVKVECSATAPTNEGATSALRAYVLKATACNQASCPGTQGPAYVERQLQATVTN